MTGLVFFDVDGTLVPHTSTSSFLAHRLGHAAALDAAEAAYAAGTLGNHEVSVLDARAWRGRTPADIDGWLAALPVVELAVAVNATPEVEAVAAHAVRGSDLRAVVPYLDRWVSAGVTTPAPP